MATSAAEYIVFVDESGDHGLESIDPNYPVFVLAFCIIEKSHFARRVMPEITEFKFRHFGHNQVILHEHEIRKDTGDFAVLRDRARKAAFLDELTALIDGLEMTVIASVIRKERLVTRYHWPANPYEIALAFGLGRTHMWLSEHGAAGASTPVILEQRGRREDDALELEFRRVCDRQNYLRATLHLERRFVTKSANVPGLQLAGLIARPIGRHVLDPGQASRAYEVIERKLRRSPRGKIEGWGSQGVSAVRKQKAPAHPPRPSADRESPVHAPYCSSVVQPRSARGT
jgi:hypothetical protein